MLTERGVLLEFEVSSEIVIQYLLVICTANMEMAIRITD